MLINAALKKGMWFLMTNYIKFCLKMIQKHEKEYPDLPTDILVDIIDVTLNRAPALYFTREQVQNHQEFCIMWENTVNIWIANILMVRPVIIMVHIIHFVKTIHCMIWRVMWLWH